MPSARPIVSTQISWFSPTARCCDVSGAKGSARLALDLPASASGAIVGRLQRAAGKVPVDEAALAACGLRLGGAENLLMQRRQRAGRIGIAGIAGQRKSLTTAAAEIDFLEFATPARLRHPAGAAITIEGFGILPDPRDGMVRPHREEI